MVRLWFLLLAAAAAGVGCASPTSHAVAPEPPGEDVEEPVATATPGLPGCVESVRDLPADPSLFDPLDPRLYGEDVIVVLKGERRLMRFSDGWIRRTDRGGDAPSCWRVALGYLDGTGQYPPGAKQKQGDRKTPEGWYRTSDKPWSSFYAAIAVHYPNSDDAARGVEQELIGETTRKSIVAKLEKDEKPNQYTKLGGEILIHGGGSSIDWTWGCVGLENSDIDALRASLPEDLRTDVLILP